MKGIVFLAIFLFSYHAHAHPGSRASDGCHYCRTNCEAYGLTPGTRHSHNGAVCDSAKNKDAGAKRYKRSYFAHWSDEDGDCRNKRAEILKERSQVAVAYSRRKNGKECTVTSGRWDDYYYAEVLVDASTVDIDHIVPLKHAWDAGAKDWSSEKRKQFANDPGNLAVTNRKYNRQKGAQSPLTWAPVQKDYYCKYLKDWIAVKTKYEMPVSSKIYEYQQKANCNLDH